MVDAFRKRNMRGELNTKNEMADRCLTRSIKREERVVGVSLAGGARGINHAELGRGPGLARTSSNVRSDPVSKPVLCFFCATGSFLTNLHHDRNLAITQVAGCTYWDAHKTRKLLHWHKASQPTITTHRITDIATTK
jgi:hypothetical protein